MKIIYLHRTQGEEPESIHILSIVNALKGLGNEVEIVGPSKKDMSTAGTNVKLLSRIKKYMPGFLFELAQVFYNFVSYKRILSSIDDYNPDFIYERYALYSFAGVMAAKRKKVPLILEVNTPYAHAWSKYYKLHFPALAKRLEKYILNKASHIITVTQVQKEFLADHYTDQDKISVCHNAISKEEFDPTISPIEIDWKIQDPVVVGFVGTMNRWQGIPILSKVIPEILKNLPNAVFLLVGDGEFKYELEQSINATQNEGRVVFTGRVAHKDVPAYVNAMDIAILPDSNTYGSPMKIFEYMAMKKAIIAPDVEPVREIMTHNKTGIIIGRSNQQDMTNAISNLVLNKELRHQLSENGYKYVIQNHTWETNARTIIDVAHYITSDENIHV